MALLDFTRFGIKEEDILNKAFSYVIGFDLGHGEISASYLNLNDNFSMPFDLFLTIGGATKIFSALFRKKDGAWAVGTTELLLPSAEGDLFTCFKVNPARQRSGELYEDTQITKRHLMQQMLTYALEQIKKSNSKDFSGKGILAVGCPSSSEWTSEQNILYYAQVLSETARNCGMDLSVVIIPESRASLLKIYKENQGTTDFQKFIDKFHKGVIVLDHGSSTLDSTAINFDTNTMCENSIPLGGAMIDDAIIRMLCKEAGHRKSDILEYEKLKLEVRNAKEAYYLSPKSIVRVFMDFIDGSDYTKKLTPDFMQCVTHETKVAYSTNTCPMVNDTWCKLHIDFLTKCKAEWLKVTGENEFEGIVLLTGGASHMIFTQENTKVVFPKATVLLDKEPSYCVSRGLSYAVQTDLEAFRLIDEAKKRIAQAIKADMITLKTMVAEHLTPIVYIYLKQKLSIWATEDSQLSLDGILKKIVADFNEDSKQEVENITKSTFGDYLNKTGEGSIKSIIVKTVNDLFESVFPGKLSERFIDRFFVGEKEWKDIIELINDKNSLDVKDSLIDKLDIEGTIERTLKGNVVSVLVALPFFLLAAGVDYIFNTKISKKIDEAFTEKRFKVCTKEEREKIYNKLVNKEEENKRAIKQSLNQSCIPADKERQIADMIVVCLDEPINKAVNNVSLYF